MHNSDSIPIFLAELVKQAESFGNCGDWPAIEEFVYHCFDEAGKERPEGGCALSSRTPLLP